METIEQLLESKGIRITAMRLLIYKFLAEKEIAVTRMFFDSNTCSIVSIINRRLRYQMV